MAIFFMACFITTVASAQVTIGSSITPTEGALLDLKENSPAADNTTSTRGFLLPRVNLTNLKPTAATGVNSLPTSIGSSATENWDLEAHIGLVVFNVKSDQCASEPIPVGSYVWSGIEWEYLGKDNSGTLAPGVEYHPAEPNPSYVAGTDPAYLANIYEGFYSAEFGTAGRWMITNLAAWAYHGINHSTNPGGSATSGSGSVRTLSGPAVTHGAAVETDRAYWSYPGGGSDGSNATEYTNNPHLGLLYTWDAATAGKGGANGQGNIYNTSGSTNANNEGNWLEGTTANHQRRIQGICPHGWHLPSDWEWSELEKYIYEHAEDFSSYTKTERQSFPNGGVWNPTWHTAIITWRPSTLVPQPPAHGTAMKSVCPTLPSVNPQGRSNTMNKGGFSALLAGRADMNNTIGLGNDAIFWNSSSAGSSSSSTTAHSRRLDNVYAAVHRGNMERNILMSVRCKKSD
jgi:hypothetical protein